MTLKPITKIDTQKASQSNNLMVQSYLEQIKQSQEAISE